MYDSTCNHISITHHIECMQNMCSIHISFSLCIVYKIGPNSLFFLSKQLQMKGVTCDKWRQYMLYAVVLWGNFSYPNSSNKRNIQFYPFHFFDHVSTEWPYFWTTGINLVPQSSQLYKIRELPAKIKISIIWVEIVFCQQQKKTTPNIGFGQTFYLIIWLSNPIAGYIFRSF